MRHYVALVHKEAESDFGVSFPDFPGCVSAGSTVEEALEMASEALTGHVECMVEDGHPIPEPTGIEAVMSDPANRHGIAALVALADPKPKSVRVNITLPEDMLRQIDSYAEAHGFTRSGFIAQAARRAMTDAA